MTQPLSSPFRDSKARLLRLLKDRKQATVAELAETLRVTRACVHSHLHDLAGVDMVRLAGVIRSGRGRPEHRYALSEAGEALFPKDYAGLANDLLEQVKQRFGEGSALELLERRNAELSRDWRDGTAHLPLRGRLERLAERLSELGYEASVEDGVGAGEDGVDGLELVLGNCPYPRTAARHPEICQAECRLLEQVLGAEVRRGSPRIVEGNACCRYGVAPAERSEREAAETGSS